MIIIVKRFILIISLLLLMIPYFSIASYAETSDNNTSYGGSEHGGGGTGGNRDDTSDTDISYGGSEHGGGGAGGNRDDEVSTSDGVSFSFTFFGHDYTFTISFLDSFMPIVRDIIFYFLLAKSVFTKFKALPAIIGQVPVIGPSDSQQVAMYNSRYGR